MHPKRGSRRRSPWQESGGSANALFAGFDVFGAISHLIFKTVSGSAFGQKVTAFDLCRCLCRQKIKALLPTKRPSFGLCCGTQRARRASRAAPLVCWCTEESWAFLSEAEPLFFVGTGSGTGQKRCLFGQKRSLSRSPVLAKSLYYYDKGRSLEATQGV